MNKEDKVVPLDDPGFVKSQEDREKALQELSDISQDKEFLMATTTFSGPIKAGTIKDTTGTTVGTDKANVGFVLMA